MTYYFPMIQQILHEATSLVIAMSIGIYAYPYMTKFMRILFFQLVIWILFYISAYAVTSYQASNNLVMNNIMVLNIAVSVEFLILTIAIGYFFKDTFIKYIAMASYLAFLTITFIQVKLSKDGNFINYAMATGSIIMTVFFILVLYKKFKSGTQSLKDSPEIWASLGLVLYFAGNVPFISIMPFLDKHSPDLSTKLFHYITDNLANIRYFSLAIAFWLVHKHKHDLSINPT